MAERLITLMLYPTTFTLSVIMEVYIAVSPDPLDCPAVQRQINA